MNVLRQLYGLIVDAWRERHCPHDYSGERSEPPACANCGRSRR